LEKGKHNQIMIMKAIKGKNKIGMPIGTCTSATIETGKMWKSHVLEMQMRKIDQQIYHVF